MLHMPTKKDARRGAFVTRRRFALVGALIVAALIPYFGRILLVPGTVQITPTTNALIANVAAVIIAFWARLSIEPFPGIRSSTIILPTAAAAHGVVLVIFMMTRLPYDRAGLTLGFVLHVLWAYGLYFLVQRRASLRIGVVPVGEVNRLDEIDQVEWVPLAAPTLDATIGCNAIVADFSADIPDEWESFLADAALAGIIVYQVKNLAESLTGRVEIDHLSENAFGSLVPARGYFHLKELLDLGFALLMLPLVLPVLAAAAIAIRFDSMGPVFFRQARIGHAGQSFTVIKFRTMAIGDGSLDPRAAAITGDYDPRVTRVGGFLRRTRIDELPQIFNIIKGEMSWIGPRPEAEILSLWYVGELPFYRYRHVVKPGISGWAQTNQGHVAEVADVHRKLQYDFYYIKYFSPWLDLLILFKTIRTMATGFGSR